MSTFGPRLEKENELYESTSIMNAYGQKTIDYMDSACSKREWISCIFSLPDLLSMIDMVMVDFLALTKENAVHMLPAKGTLFIHPKGSTVNPIGTRPPDYFPCKLSRYTDCSVYHTSEGVDVEFKSGEEVLLHLKISSDEPGIEGKLVDGDRVVDFPGSLDEGVFQVDKSLAVYFFKH